MTRTKAAANAKPRGTLKYGNQGHPYLVLEPDNSLRSKALVPGNANDAIQQATESAEEALNQLSFQFSNWMVEECDRLRQAHFNLHRNGMSSERLDQLFTASHDIRGQAHTLGYPVAGAMASLLCGLIEQAPDATKIPLNVLDQHVNSIKAVVRQDITGKGTQETNSILQGLQLLNITILNRLTPEDTDA
jgi:hypothetical protein